MDFVTANYIQAEIADYKGHPLINALKPINSPEDTANLIKRMPIIRPEEVILPAHIRRHAMLRIMDGFLYPTKAHLQLEQTISCMIRQGYLSRNIADRSYQDTINRTIEITKSVARNAGNEALISSVFGCSGAGKSTAVEAILAGYDQVIVHPNYQHVQIVWLKVETPHNASVKSLCINFFRALDSLLDNNSEYERQYVKPKAGTDLLLGDFAHVAALHSIGLLVIDEIQHLDIKTNNSSEVILQFFIKLTNIIKLPILFIGTPKAYKLFAPLMSSARRSAQVGSLNWEKFNNSNKTNKGTEWERFFERLWSLQWFKSPQPLTLQMQELFWDCSQGIAHVAVALFYLSQTRAITLGNEHISEELVVQVFNEELHMIKPMISALRSGLEREIEKFTDLEIPKSVFINNAERFPNTTQPLLSAKNKEDAPTVLDKLINMLIDMGIGDDIAPIVAEQAVSELPNGNLFDLVAHIKNLKEQKPENKELKKPKIAKLEPAYVVGDLRLALDKKGNTYKRLKESGVVLRITDYL
ncbi:ATP-binding protein [Alishewanella sp. HL-SH06]|uniref:ATP-binding protein n=1 Tax=Alishewanella sp. HL-SH06 TaxID=3461144 RepID=UPI004042ADFC